MPIRKGVLAPGEIYHVYNKAVGSDRLFENDFYVNEALKRIQFYKFETSLKYIYFNKYKKNLLSKELFSIKYKENRPLIEVYAHSIMPTHYHFVIKELIENGLKVFISKFQMSYARLYNAKNTRGGVVFRGRFRTKRVTNTDHFKHIVRYVHLNPVTAHLFEFNDLPNSLRSSYLEYVKNDTKYDIVNKEFVLKQFNTLQSFTLFHRDQVDYQRKLAKIKKLLF
ncbi:MAG: hypothetical protein WEC80_02600 [Patescibacteria group bacterium]